MCDRSTFRISFLCGAMRFESLCLIGNRTLGTAWSWVFFLCTFPPFRFIVRGWRAAFVCERLIFYISNCFSHFGGAGYDLEISRCFFSTDSKKIPVIDPRCVAYEFHGRQAHRPPSISSALTNERWKNTNKKKIRKFQGFIKVL